MKLTNEFVKIPEPDMKSPKATEKGKPSFIMRLGFWFSVVLLLLLGVSLFPSVTGILFILAGIIELPWKQGLHGAQKTIAVVALFLIGAFLTPTGNPQEPEQVQTQTPEVEVEAAAPERQEASAQSESAAQPVSYINADFDGDGYERISAELLYEYGQYMEGRKVVTVVTAAHDSYKDRISGKTEGREDALTYSISCELSVNIPEGVIKENDAVTVAGTIGAKTPLLSTVTLKDCSIIGRGEIAQEIKDAESYYREICERYKKAHDDAIIQAERDERNSYISECVTVSYSDVERNPDNYKKTKIKVSGSVEQVIEGWFNTVTLRVKDGNGDTWVITYLRKDGESRILEGDSITAYGECDGVTNVTNLLGQQMTYPSMNMEYFN